MDAPPLSSRTLRLLPPSHGGRGPEWWTVDGLGLEHVLSGRSNPRPPVGVVGEAGRGTRIEGRFFPRVRYPDWWLNARSPAFLNKALSRGEAYGPAVLIRAHEDPLVLLAEAVHELAHFASYCEECRAVPQSRAATVRCRYKGEHDQEFYARLEPMYRAAGVPTYAARAVEGDYDYPAHWRADSWAA